MNRRGFFGTVAAAVAGFAILPPATTYTRLWKATKQIPPEWIPNPEWVNAPYEIRFEFGPFVVANSELPIRYKIGKNGVWQRVEWLS